LPKARRELRIAAQLARGTLKFVPAHSDLATIIRTS
jgi:hypothetical protein